ncbi:hypothetical protein CYMTET_29882, partial [Cymbomonas tetramitiformis]
ISPCASAHNKFKRLSMLVRLCTTVFLLVRLQEVVTGCSVSLNGYSWEASTTTIGANIWNDRTYTFSTLPTLLTNTNHIRGPHKSIAMGTTISLTLSTCSSQTFYVAVESAGPEGLF